MAEPFPFGNIFIWLDTSAPKSVNRLTPRLPFGASRSQALPSAAIRPRLDRQYHALPTGLPTAPLDHNLFSGGAEAARSKPAAFHAQWPRPPRTSRLRLLLPPRSLPTCSPA